MNELNLYFLLSVEEIIAIKKTEIRNCKIKDMTLSELEELFKYMNREYRGLVYKKNDAVNTIMELVHRFNNKKIIVTIKR